MPQKSVDTPPFWGQRKWGQEPAEPAPSAEHVEWPQLLYGLPVVLALRLALEPKPEREWEPELELAPEPELEPEPEPESMVPPLPQLSPSVPPLESSATPGQAHDTARPS